MTIFNKISSFAHKTKDQAVARNIISKDKRLDQSLSNMVQPDKIHFAQMTDIGLESKVSVMAFDTVAGLLAIAGYDSDTQTTHVRIFGKGISSTIPLPHIAPIKYLQFKIGCSLLVLIDKKNIIYTLDLKKQQIQYMLPTKGIITSYCYGTGTDWLFIGFGDGCVDVFDLRLGQLAKYGVPDLVAGLDGQQQNQRDSGNIVVSLEMHPTNLNWLLIGYETRAFLWDIKEQMIHSTYMLPSSQVRLSSLAWCPQGDRFMAGYDDGYLHLWQVDHEHRPVLSRQVFPSLDKSQPCEPVYKLSWYCDDNLQKNYLVVCGGSAIKDIHGLHVLEFDIDQQGDARKQSIIPSATDLMDFILLWSEPYLFQSPLGILLLDCNGALHAHGLDHGYPSLTLPPSLAFTQPFVTNACFIPMATEQMYRKLTTLTDADRETRYMPLMGGGAGPKHIYKLPSNDILVTLHVGEIIQFWDASYTSLRPLSQLTIRCHDDLDDSSLYICCLDTNATTGTVAIGFNNGTILVYEIADNRPSQQEDHHQLSEHEQSAFHETNARFISQCDDTINELAGILDEMEKSSSGDSPHPDSSDINVTNDQALQPTSSSDNTNPFLSQQNDSQLQPETIPQESDNDHHVENAPHHQFSDSCITTLKRSTKPFGYSPDMKIQLDGAIESITSTGPEIIACATSNGRISVINTTMQKVCHAIDISDLMDGETQKDEQDNAQAKSNDVPTISCVKFINTYAYKEASHISTQLFFSLNNGDIYQCDVLSPTYDSPVLLYHGSKTTIPIQDIYVIDLDGVEQTATDCIIRHDSASQATEHTNDGPPQPWIDNPEETSATSPKENLESPPSSHTEQPLQPIQEPQPQKSPSSTPRTSVERGRSFLRRKSTKRSIKNTSRPVSSASTGSQEEAWEVLSKTSTTMTASTTMTSSSSESNNSNTKHSTGRHRTPEYPYQEQPHYLIVSGTTSISILLSGYGIKLYEFRLQDLDGHTNQGDSIIRTMPLRIDDMTCLSVLLQSKQLVVLSLPHLHPIARTPLPHTASRLNESTLTRDGRILLWTGRYEMQQWMYLHSHTSLPYGHSVELFDINKQLPPHPCKTALKSNKKTWFGAVAGAFKKEPLSLDELDSIMGRINTGLDHQNQNTQRQGSSSTSESAPSSGIKKSGVFKELGDKMDERGQRLNLLGQKFSDMNDASGDFLKAVKEYNERQAQKKWWQL